MPLDTSIFANYLARPKSPGEYASEYMQRDAQTQNLLASRLQLQQQQQQMADQQTVRNALVGLGANATNDQRINTLRGTGTPLGYAQADALEKSMLDRRKTEAEAGKNRAETFAKEMSNYKEMLGAAQTPEQAQQVAQYGMQHPVLGPVLQRMGDPRIPTDPQQFQQWKLGAALNFDKLISLTVPDANAKLSSATTQRGQDMTDARTREEGAANRGVTIRGQNLTDARAKATLAKDYAVAGMNPDGSTNESVEAMARAIASGQAAPITGFALAKPQGQAVMRRVFEINPTYDETTYGAKAKAAKDFTSGSQGNALRSVSTANAHLDQMGELVDALNNGNMQLVNKISNAYAAQTGNPAPTNFDAVKNIIGQEVVKAIVAGGGTGGERDEAARAFTSAASPAQLKGVIQHYRMVMGAQQQNLLEQRRAAGLTDETLPSYSRQKPPAASAGGRPPISSFGGGRPPLSSFGSQ
jgi:hypothetical protein